MKIKKLKVLARNTLFYILATTLIFAFTECSRKITFKSSSVVPAATGHVKVKRNSNNNYVIQVDVSNLAEVSQLTPPKQTYVVWMVSEQQDTKNLGQIVSSNKLNASFETSTASKPIKIFITAENDPTAYYPTEPIVLTTENFWDK